MPAAFIPLRARLVLILRAFLPSVFAIQLGTGTSTIVSTDSIAQSFRSQAAHKMIYDQKDLESSFLMYYIHVLHACCISLCCTHVAHLACPACTCHYTHVLRACTSCMYHYTHALRVCTITCMHCVYASLHACTACMRHDMHALRVCVVTRMRVCVLHACTACMLHYTHVIQWTSPCLVSSSKITSSCDVVLE